VTSVSAFTAAAEQGNLFVALSDLDVPVGFALLSMLDGMVFLKEMDVDPAHARKGIGRALLQAVVEHASSLELPGVLLTTYRHVPWNAPFYERFGFRIVGPDEMTPGLAAQLAREAEQGLDPKTRVGMVYRLAP
jgi:GNAT superfamily N-acetyltransferase